MAQFWLPASEILFFVMKTQKLNWHVQRMRSTFPTKFQLILQMDKKLMKTSTYLQAQQNIFESSQKLDLIRLSLELHRQQLPAESSIASELKMEIDSTHAMSPGNMTFTTIGDAFSNNRGSLRQYPSSDSGSGKRNSISVSRAASVTGKLEVSNMKSIGMHRASDEAFYRSP